MKKATLKSLVSYLNGETVDNIAEIKAELEAELNKDKAKSEATANEYAEIHNKVMEVLEGAKDGVSAQEIADEIGVTKGKVVYGLTHYWTSEIVKDTSGKATLYRKA